MAQVREHLDLPPRALAEVGREKVKDKTAPIVPVGLRKNLGWMKPLVRPFRGTAAFEAVRGTVARKTVYPPLTDEVRQRLNDYFGPSIEVLEQMSGQSLSHWYKPAERSE